MIVDSKIHKIRRIQISLIANYNLVQYPAKLQTNMTIPYYCIIMIDNVQSLGLSTMVVSSRRPLWGASQLISVLISVETVPQFGRIDSIETRGCKV